MNRIHNPDDAVAIKNFLFDNFSIEATLLESEIIWREISKAHGSDWLDIHNNTLTLDLLRGFLDRIFWGADNSHSLT